MYGSGSGVTVSSVVPGSPADSAGLKVGDTITSVDGKKVSKGAELVADIASRKPGSKASLELPAQRKSQETTVTIADRAKLFAARLGDDQENGDESAPKQSKFGVTVRKVTPEMADRLDMPAGKGVIVQDVKPGSFAEDVNLGRGDIILEVNKQPVNSEEDFAKVESSLKSGQDVVFLVLARFVAAGWNHLPRRYTSVTEISPAGTGTVASNGGSLECRRQLGFFILQKLHALGFL